MVKKWRFTIVSESYPKASSQSVAVLEFEPRMFNLLPPHKHLSHTLDSLASNFWISITFTALIYP